MLNNYDAKQRKERPVYSGVLKYFPDALLEVANLSRVGNEQHNPGQPLHWAKEKSQDEADALVRHLLDAGTFDTDGVRHSAKVAWRALALLQRELDAAAAENPYIKEMAPDYVVRITEAAQRNVVEPTVTVGYNTPPLPLITDDEMAYRAAVTEAELRMVGGHDWYGDLEPEHSADNGELPKPPEPPVASYEGSFDTRPIPDDIPLSSLAG